VVVSHKLISYFFYSLLILALPNAFELATIQFHHGFTYLVGKENVVIG